MFNNSKCESEQIKSFNDGEMLTFPHANTSLLSFVSESLKSDTDTCCCTFITVMYMY